MVVTRPTPICAIRAVVRILVVLIVLTGLLTPARGQNPALAAGTLPLSPAVQRAFRNTVNGELSPSTPGAIVGIWAPGRLTWTYAAGLADVSTNRAVSLNDSTYIGSITKTFVGTLVLQLVDEGKLSLDAPIGRWLRNVPDAEHVTIRELLNHSSGIFDYLQDPRWMEQFLKSCTVDGTHATCTGHWQPQQLVAVAAKHPLYFRPGTGFHYSNTNFIILGLLVEKLTGQPLQSVLSEKLLRPLHLTHTYLRSDASQLAPSLHGYTVRPPITLSVTDVAYQDLSWGWAAGGIVSTVDDLHVWAQALAKGTLLSSKLQRERLAATVQSGSTYGLAVALDTAFGIGHSGGVRGYVTEMWYIPDLRATLVVMVNGDTDASGNDSNPAMDLGDKIVQIVRLLAST